MSSSLMADYCKTPDPAKQRDGMCPSTSLGNSRRAVLAAGLVVCFTARPTDASTGGGGSGLPWETALQKLVVSFTGPVMQGVLVLAIVALGFAVMWSEGPVLRRAFGLLLGGAIAAAAVSIALALFDVPGATF